jgi:hypothetical protein
METKITNRRRWLYGGLALAVSGLMTASFAMPWWSCVINSGTHVNIYGWGLRHNLVELESYVINDITPTYQTILAWVYLALSVGLILLSLRLGGKKGILLMAFIGLGYIAYAAVAGYAVIAPRVAEFGINLQGQTIKTVSGWVVVLHSRFEIGYYLAYVSGFLCLVLGLTRNLIKGKPKPDRKSVV